LPLPFGLPLFGFGGGSCVAFSGSSVSSPFFDKSEYCVISLSASSVGTITASSSVPLSLEPILIRSRGSSFALLSDRTRARCVISATSFSASLSSPFQPPHPLHLHFPRSSGRLMPGGACPFTNLQYLHINAMRFFGNVSSSPSNTSISRSYHRGWSGTAEY